MKSFAGCFLVSLMFVTSAATPADKPSWPDYYPLRQGNTWTYNIEVKESTIEMTNKIAKIEKIDDLKLARLESLVGGRSVASEHLSSDERGIYRHRFNGVEVAPPFCVLQLPVKDGATWHHDMKVGTETMKGTCKMTLEDVEVPAGKYKTVRVDMDSTFGGQKIKASYWFAKDVGVVRQAIDHDGTTGEVRLEKFERGK